MKWHIPIPYSPFFWKIILLQPRGRVGGGGGTWPLVPLAMPVTVVQPGFVNGERGGGGGQSDRAGEGVGREIFWKFVYENDIFLHIWYHY